MIDAELAAFLESGCATIVGLVSPTGEPFATRGWGTTVTRGAPVLRLVVGAGPFARAGHVPGDGGRFAIALTGGDIRTLRSVQVKGTAHDLAPCTPDDLACSARFRAEFFTAVHETDGTPVHLLERLAPADLLVVTVDVDEVFDQTPGPGAGAPLPATGTGA